MIHHILTESEIQNLNELHRVKTCNTCSNFLRINNKCKIRNIIVNYNTIQCHENINYKYHFNKHQISGKNIKFIDVDYILKNLGVK